MRMILTPMGAVYQKAPAEIDLDELSKELKDDEGASDKSVPGAEKAGGCRVSEDIRNRPEWMIMEVVPSFRPIFVRWFSSTAAVLPPPISTTLPACY